MPTTGAPERRAALDQVVGQLVSQLAGLLDAWRVRGLPLADLPFAVLHVVEPLISLAADLAALWYQDAAPELPYRAVAAPLPPEEKTLASIEWALAPLRRPAEQPPVPPDAPGVQPQHIPHVHDAEADRTGRWAVSHAWEQGDGWGDALSRLTGSMTRVVLGGARGTTVLNAESEPGAGWARVASPDACAFCRMLATRDGSYGSLYTSAASALHVVGRSDRVGRGRKGLGRFAPDAGAVRHGGPRGSRRPGELYHDHCRCVAFEVRPGRSFAPPEHARGWHDEYEAALRDVDGAGERPTMKNIVHAWDARLRAGAETGGRA